jgi:hypothetical protein
VEAVHCSATPSEKEGEILQPVEVAVTENKSAWHLMDSAPDEVSRERPVILLVHAINVTPERDSPFWLRKRDGDG